MTERTKQCRICRRVLPLNLFKRTTLVAGGYHLHCNSCSKPVNRVERTGSTRLDLAFAILESKDFKGGSE